MTTPMLQKLQEYLDSVSSEQFASDWAEVEAMNLNGPSVAEFISSFKQFKPNAIVTNLEVIDDRMTGSQLDFLPNDQQYCFAA